MFSLHKVFIFLVLIQVSLFPQDNTKLEEIVKNNTLKVCIWPQYYGISFIDPRTQKLNGIDSDLAVELAKYLNVNLKYVKSSFLSLSKDVTSNKCDIAMFAIANTKARKAKMRFTSAHLASDIYAVTTKNNKKINNWNDIDKKGIILAISKGTYHDPLVKNIMKNAKVIAFNGFKEREDEVQSGRADAFMTDYPYGKKVIEKTTWAKLIEPNKIHHITSYSWTMAYGNDKFYNKVEEFIKEIKKDGRLLKLAKKYRLEAIVKID